ncbi:MAG TPA: ABC transporter permease [Chitinophaga sp.]|uniref:ABC transporter permease n=1 Tax=Chitinophaga sp. TaxID=1869181 RepID=UPI002F954C4C
MFRNYLKIAWRNLHRSKAYALINITGLSAGMAVAMLIGLWIWDEVSYNKYHQHYDRIVQVMRQATFQGVTSTGSAVPIPLAEYLRTHYGSDFKSVVTSSWALENIIAAGDNKLTSTGIYMEPQAPEMLSLQMLEGSRQTALQDVNTILLSASLARSLFGSQPATGKIVKLNNKTDVKVSGVYADIPHNSSFSDLAFIAPFSQYLASSGDWAKHAVTDWNEYSFQMFAELNPQVDAQKVSGKIQSVIKDNSADESNPMLLLHPMRKWKLYSEFQNGINTGGDIRFVWLFGLIGVFVLLLGCINFMNLSTARAARRAREVGIRKAIGSAKEQLVGQFLSESLLVVAIGFCIALLLTMLFLPWFNNVADKQIALPWGSVSFWLLCAGFMLVTGVLAGSYPAFYLSAFQPVKVLKGTFRAGRFAAMPRKVLVIVQFAVSVILIIGTVIIFQQIQYTKDRAIGYSRDGLITIPMNTPDLFGHYDVLQKELQATGMVENMAESSSPTTQLFSRGGENMKWRGKREEEKILFGNIACTHDFGATIGWQILAGRDFSREYATDSSAMILNASAAAVMGLKDPVGEKIQWGKHQYTVIGVVKDLLMESPFAAAIPTVFRLNYDWANVITVKIKPGRNNRAALDKIAAVFKKYNPGSPFNYKFNDQEYGKKFMAEERIGKLAGCFAILAILISCLGIFGLASFTAEQRTKEIGVRKVLGATVLSIWALLSGDFLKLVFIAFLLAAPAAYYGMQHWLQQYEYRTPIHWWIFMATGGAALGITLTVVSYQAIKAAVINPVKSLRTE